MKSLTLPAYLTGFSKRADGSASLRFTTQEVPASAYAEFADMQGEFGWVAFRASEIEAPELPETDAEETKSYAKRLRNTLFVLYKQEEHDTSLTFEAFYADRMEKFIEHVKTKLHE